MSGRAVPITGKVLIIDGDSARVGQLGQVVATAGGEPIEVTSTAAAMRAGAAADLVILAGAEGLEALPALSAAYPALPRITLFTPTAPADVERLADAVRAALRARRPQTPDFEALTVDRLTGALGYHYFRLRLAGELERAARYTRALSIMLVDVDDLRGLNDRLGRAAGDFALAQVAQSLAAGARSVDVIGRWSGGGFALLLPETAVGAAYGLAERLRADLAARRLPAPPELIHPSRPLRVTVSCGVASLYKDGAPRPQSLVARADHALWRAKLGGRNRSIVD
jgi:diguanylate cyclase (GGDEF)-like protein